MKRPSLRCYVSWRGGSKTIVQQMEGMCWRLHCSTCFKTDPGSSHWTGKNPREPFPKKEKRAPLQLGIPSQVPSGIFSDSLRAAIDCRYYSLPEWIGQNKLSILHLQWSNPKKLCSQTQEVRNQPPWVGHTVHGRNPFRTT